MCGRYGLTVDQEEISIAYGVRAILAGHQPRYNIAPSQEVPVMLADRGVQRVEDFRWGLVPANAPSPKIGYRTINARSESAAEKPAFRGAWENRRRCVILADGFYEWDKPPAGKGPRVPYWIRMADARPFGFAGLWEHWDDGARGLFTCTVLTTQPNALVAPIHDRMPVILGKPSDWTRWTNPRTPSDQLSSLLRPYTAEEMCSQAVSTYVNRADHEGPECLAPPVSTPQTMGEGHQMVLEL